MTNPWVAALSFAAVFAAKYGAPGGLHAPAHPPDFWAVGGLVLGLLLVVAAPARWYVLGGAGLAAVAGIWLRGAGAVDAIVAAVVTLTAPALAAWTVRTLAPSFRLATARELAILVFAGLPAMAAALAVLGIAWEVAKGGNWSAPGNFGWLTGTYLGGLLVAPLVISWSQFRAKRSGGLPMPAFAAGAVACALYLGTLVVLFDAVVEHRFGGTVGIALTYLPLLFLAPIALLWGLRGVTLATLVGAMIAIVNTHQGEGPFAAVEAFPGESRYELQAYLAATALLGLLIAALVESQRRAAAAATDWRIRFEAAIGAHRMLAYDWDPVTGGFALTGDARAGFGTEGARVATLADWLGLVAADERERVRAEFERRASGAAGTAPLTYLMSGRDGALVATDDARVIRDHDDSVHRIAGIVRLAPPAAG